MRRWLAYNLGPLHVMCVLMKVIPEPQAGYLAFKWGEAICSACSWMEHNFNSLHVMCRLSKIMPLSHARYLALKWEKVVHPILYW